MYYFVAGFFCGVYVGTRYDLEPYVHTVEERFASFAADMHERKRKREAEAKQEEVATLPETLKASLNSFFSSEKKSSQ